MSDVLILGNPIGRCPSYAAFAGFPLLRTAGHETVVALAVCVWHGSRSLHVHSGPRPSESRVVKSLVTLGRKHMHGLRGRYGLNASVLAFHVLIRLRWFEYTTNIHIQLHGIQSSISLCYHRYIHVRPLHSHSMDVSYNMFNTYTHLTVSFILTTYLHTYILINLIYFPTMSWTHLKSFILHTISTNIIIRSHFGLPVVCFAGTQANTRPSMILV